MMDVNTIFIERQLFPATSRVFLHAAVNESMDQQRLAQHTMTAHAAGLNCEVVEGVVCCDGVPWHPEYDTSHCLNLVLAAGIRIDHARVVVKEGSPTRRGHITARIEVAPHILLLYSETYTGELRRLFTFRAVAWTLATMYATWCNMNEEDRTWLYAQGAALRDSRRELIEAKAARDLEDLERGTTINTFDRAAKRA